MLVSYGITFSSGRIVGDIYVNYSASIAMEFIGYSLGFLLMDRYGRRVAVAVSLFVGGIPCLVSIVTIYVADGKDDNWTFETINNNHIFFYCKLIFGLFLWYFDKDVMTRHKNK